MALGDGDDVLDVGAARTQEVAPGIGPVDSASHGGDDVVLDRRRIGVIVAVVRSAAMLRRDDEAAPGLGTEGATAIGDAGGCDRKHGNQNCHRATGKLARSSHGEAPCESCGSN